MCQRKPVVRPGQDVAWTHPVYRGREQRMRSPRLLSHCSENRAALSRHIGNVPCTDVVVEQRLAPWTVHATDKQADAVDVSNERVQVFNCFK